MSAIHVQFAATAIVTGLRRSESKVQIAHQLATDYTVPLEEALQDVHDYCKLLLEHGIIDEG
jgi:hypothetical protein